MSEFTEGQQVYRAFSHCGGLNPRTGIPVVCHYGYVRRLGDQLVVQQGLEGSGTYHQLAGWYASEAEARATLAETVEHYGIRLLEQARELRQGVAS